MVRTFSFRAHAAITASYVSLPETPCRPAGSRSLRPRGRGYGARSKSPRPCNWCRAGRRPSSPASAFSAQTAARLVDHLSDHRRHLLAWDCHR